MLEKSAIILSGGGSTRMKGDKGLRVLCGAPLVNHVVNRVSSMVEEVIVVVGSELQKQRYVRIIRPSAEVIVDSYSGGSPLIGAITGFEHTKARYALVTGCDAPLISGKAVQLLFDGAEGHDASTFIWPNGWIEPLAAVYGVEPSLKKALGFYREGDLRLRSVLRALPRVNLIPIDRLREIDPELLTLFDVDTEEALLEAEKKLK